MPRRPAKASCLTGVRSVPPRHPNVLEQHPKLTVHNKRMDGVRTSNLNLFPPKRNQKTHIGHSVLVDQAPKLIRTICERSGRTGSSITSTGPGAFLFPLRHGVRGGIKPNLDAFVAQTPDDGSDRGVKERAAVEPHGEFHRFGEDRVAAEKGGCCYKITHLISIELMRGERGEGKTYNL
jgi:hypothetical protein